MIENIIVPDMGEEIAEAQIVEWTKHEGAEVNKGEVLLIIETDKATLEIESPQSGYLHIIGRAGQSYPTNEVIGWIAESLQEHQAQRDKPVSAAVAPAAEAAEKPTTPVRTEPAPAKSQAAGGVSASPLARKLAEAHDLDLAAIQGTGPGGRIVKEDVVKTLEARSGPSVDQKPPGRKIKQVIPLAGDRKVIYEKMHRSLRETAQSTITMEADAGRLVSFRRELLEAPQAAGVKISYNAILIKALAMALKDHPRFNAGSDGRNITLWESIDICLAMDMPDGLVAPVIRDADQKVLADIQKDIETLFAKARDKKLSLDEIKGGTFTLTNLGALGVEIFTPILNYGQVGILGVGRIAQKPVVADEQIAPAIRVTLSLTFDHRIVDGADAARFLKAVIGYVEQPRAIDKQA